MTGSPGGVRQSVLLAIVIGVVVVSCVEATPATSTEQASPSTRDLPGLEGPTRPTYVRATPLPEEVVERNTPEPSPEAEAAFFECLEQAGYNREDWRTFNPVDGEIYDSGDDPDRSAFREVEDICMHESGVGHVAGFDPEYVAASNESYLIEAQCMQDLGWSAFPDPVPWEGDRLESGLGLAIATGTFAPPIDPEEKERYESDREYCGIQSGMTYLRE